MQLRHGSLFSGGGGFDLAADIMGWENVIHCEKDEFCQRILQYYWPHAASFTDIKNFNAKPYKGKIDIITGGFPCQPFSSAGKRRGTSDDRYLWPDMLRIIRTIRPRWIVGENVYGLINWSDGLVFDQVQSDLEAEGYEVTAFVLPASGINAPHRRYRVWIVAYHSRYAAGRRAKPYPGSTSFQRNFSETGEPYPRSLATAGTNSNGKRLEGRTNPGGTAKSRANSIQHPSGFYQHSQWRNWPTQPPLCGGDDGLPARLDSITLSKWRRQSIKLFGNAIVPQVALQIFKAIEACEHA